MEFNKPITEDSEGFWNQYIVYPLSMLITYFAKLLGNDFGLAIIIVTFLIRLAILPLMIKQIQNSKATQEIQPELQRLREKYRSKDQKTQQKLQQETMELFQKHGINPLAGCLPVLIQMPILIGFYHAIMRTREIAEHSFLWFDLGERDPYFILPLLAGVLTFVQQKLMMAGSANLNPQMQTLLWMMPIMVIIFAVSLPAALSLYWVVGNIFTIVQTLIMNSLHNPSKKAGGAQK